MSYFSTRIFNAVLLLASFSLIFAPPVAAATVKKPAPPVRITYVKGYTPTMIGDYPNASMQILVKDTNYTLTAPGTGMAVTNVSVPPNAKNKDLVYVSTMNVGDKNAPTSMVYEFNLKTGKSKQLFSEKNTKRQLRVVGIDGTNLILVQASQSIEGHCSSLWTGRYNFFTLDVQKPAKTVKAYTVSAGLKKLGETEEQACKQSFGFKKT